MQRIMITLAAVLLAFSMPAGALAEEASRRAVADAMEAGHWDEAVRMARLRLDAGDGQPSDLAAVRTGLAELNRIEQAEAIIESAVRKYDGDAAMLFAAAEEYGRLPNESHQVAGEFRRGYPRGGGEIYSTTEANRVRVLQLAKAALDAVGDDPDLLTKILGRIESALTGGRDGKYAWRLQKLTNLQGELPPPEQGYGSRAAVSAPPVDATGEAPLLYEIPVSWEAAKNDGERNRWIKDQIAQVSPEWRKRAELSYAGFLARQFGVQSLVQQGWFPQPNDEGPSNETSALAVETLGDEETIARLATGVRRFTLPEGHRFIELYRKHEAWQKLAWAYVNRNQLPKAAEALRKAIAAEENEHRKPERQGQLDQIIKPWVRFESVSTKPAGTGAALRLIHRNVAKAKLVARRIKIEQLLGDIRATLKDPPAQGVGRSLDVENLGWRLLVKDQRRYVGDQVASWSVEIETPNDHRDGVATIASPLQDAGAYLVTVQPLGSDGEPGAESNVVVWVADTVLVRKPTPGGVLYQVLDARDGSPVGNAAVELFGFRQSRRDAKGERFQKPRIETRTATGSTDEGGIALLNVAPDAGEQGHNWLATATTPEGRLAHLGFANIWHSPRNDQPPQTTKTFVVTDRPVYRPGDSVEFKAWIGKPNYAAAAAPESDAEPVPSEFAHQEFQIDLYDARGEKVATQRLTADAYGGIVGSHLTKTSASLGVYRIDIVGFGGGSFRVEEYRKPEFEVVVDAPEEPTRLGEAFEATLRAKYYAGTPVRGGTVKYKVIRNKRTDRWLPIRPWDWLYGRGYGWLGQDATWRSDWHRWGCFAPLPPWWSGPTGPPEVVAEGEAELDANGELRLPIDTAIAAQRHPNSDHNYAITAEVTDAGRRTVSGGGSVLAARRPLDVTVWLDRGFYDVGDTARARVSVRRPDGKSVAGGGELRLMKIGPPVEQPTDSKNGELVDPEETLVQSWRLASGAGGAAEMRLKASEPGRYRLVYRSEAIDDEPVEGGLIFSIRGPGYDGGEFRFGDLELTPDKPEYAPGETMRLMVNTDRAGATVSLFVRPVGGVYDAPQVLRLSGKSTVIELPITREDLPNFYVEAHTVSDGRLHTVTKRIVVPPASRVLQVAASPSAATYLPGEEGKLGVRITDAEGNPIVGQATLAVYDRSIDAIAGGPSSGDIRKQFWDWTRGHSPSVTHSLLRSEGPVVSNGTPVMRPLGAFGNVMPRRGGGGGMFFGRTRGHAIPTMMADDLAMSEAMPMSKAMAAPGSPTPEEPAVAVRENFADTALWIGTVETDANGFAEVAMPLPESLTAWRVRVWAVSDGLRVGQGEAEVVTRKDLMVRLRAPRFLVEGDEATLSALVQNESSRELTVKVRLESDGEAIATPAPASQTVTVAAGGEALVDWRVTASAEGDARLRAIAIAEGENTPSDGMQIQLPVLVHGAEIVESFSAVIPPEERIATFELIVPEDRRPEATRLEVRYTPTLMGAMLDTLPYLIEYPHGCTEQTLNRFLPTAIVRKTLTDLGVDLEALQPEVPAAAPPEQANPVYDAVELDRIVTAGVERLTDMQLSDGGWGWFSGFGEHSSPHTTAVVVRGLGVARRSGVAVSDNVLQRGQAWLAGYRERQLAALANVDDEGNRLDDDQPWKRHPDNLDALIELTLGEADQPNETMLRRLFADRLTLAPYSLATLGLALHLDAERDGETAEQSATERDGVIRYLRQYVEQDDENQTAYLNLPGGYWWRWYGSEFEAHAYFLRLLSATEPKGELAPRLVKYLLANRQHATRWNSTRDTALVVEAMADYVRSSGEAATDGTVEVWLDGKLRDTQHYTAEDAIHFDGRFVLEGEELAAGRHTLELRRQGEGRLYSGVSLTNFSLEDDLRAAGLEVRVKRRVQRLVPVEATGDDVDARGGVLAPKVERYRRVDVPNLGTVNSGDLIEVELTIASKNDYEYLLIEDPKPAGFEPVEVRSGYTGNSLGAYVEFRDQRVLFYARTLARGERTVRYRLRAETPGRFSALPTQIRAMYAPDLRGNSDEVRVLIEDAE